MDIENALPCRHRGAPSDDIVKRVAELIETVAYDESYLYPQGLTSEEFLHALPNAIESMRGRQSASNIERRNFLSSLLDHLANVGAITEYVRPTYGRDTVYRVSVPAIGDIAVIQKGCPDGKHSTVAWSAPEWAAETYIWWLCPSLKNEPGWHVAAGVRRLRREFFSDRPDTIDGVIFHDATCGSDVRTCPKIDLSVRIDGRKVPPPCIWVFPERSAGPVYNWTGERAVKFPQVLLSGFGINELKAQQFTGHIGFKVGSQGTRTTISSRYGAGRSTSSRS